MNVMLIAPSLQHQDMIQEQVFDILEDQYNLEFNNLYAYGYQNNSSAFSEMCSVGGLLDDNEALQRRVAERTNTPINPTIKVYDLCIMIGRPDQHTHMHLLKCMTMKTFNRLLIVDLSIPEEMTDEEAEHLLVQRYGMYAEAHHGNGEITKVKIATHIKGDMDKKAIAHNIAKMYDIVPLDGNDQNTNVA